MFAVFGVTHNHCRKVAEKKVRRTIKVKKQLVTRSDKEFEAAIQQKTVELFEKMPPVMLSAEYSSPSIAQKFAQMAESEGADRLELRIRAPIRKTVKGKEKIVHSWLKWDYSRDYGIT